MQLHFAKPTPVVGVEFADSIGHDIFTPCFLPSSTPTTIFGELSMAVTLRARW